MKLKLKPLSKQVMVVTGASSGIGLVTARRAAAAGCKVLLVSRDEAALRDIVRDIEARGGTADYAVADVGDEAQVSRVADKAVSRFGGFDTWVNDAGIGLYAPLTETPTNEHERLFRTNYWGVVFGSLAAVRHLARRGGALVNVASIASDIPLPLQGAYTASKHAVAGYTDTLRIELERGRAPIAVSLIKPSAIDTPLPEHARNHMKGEGRLPPPAYAPEVVADAILDAAQTGRREIVVGGAGRAQTLFGRLAPAAFDWIAETIIPLLIDEDEPRTETDSLDEPSSNGRERSRLEHGRPFSLYTSAALHPGAVVGIGLVAVLAAAALTGLRRA